MLEVCPYSCPIPEVVKEPKKVSVLPPDMKKIEDEKLKIPLWILIVIGLMLISK